MRSARATCAANDNFGDCREAKSDIARILQVSFSSSIARRARASIVQVDERCVTWIGDGSLEGIMSPRDDRSNFALLIVARRNSCWMARLVAAALVIRTLRNVLDFNTLATKCGSAATRINSLTLATCATSVVPPARRSSRPFRAMFVMSEAERKLTIDAVAIFMIIATSLSIATT